MKKTVSIVTLSNNADGEAFSLLKKAACAIGDCSVTNVADVAGFAGAAAETKADIVFAAADLSQFLKAKFFTIKALACGIARSSELIAAMGNNAPADPKEKDLQAAVPKGARTYFTLDGLYSAFTFNRPDGSLLVFLPLEKEKLRQLFATGLGIFKVKEQPAESTEKSPVKDYRQDVKDFIAAGKSASIAQYGFFKPVYQVLSKFENSEFAFALSSQVSEKSVTVAEAARNAALTSGMNFGIAVSSILVDPETQESYIEVCVASTEAADVAKVYAESGETANSHAIAAVVKLCSMLSVAAQNGIKRAAPPQPQKKVEPPKKKSPLPLILAISGICAATVISIIIANQG